MANAEVRVAIVGDNSSLQRSLAESKSTLGTWGAAVGKIALAAGVAAAGGLALLGKASVDAASQAQQSLGATETVFGKYADTVIRQSQRAATALGLSADEYRNNANVLGSLLGNQGVAADKLAGKTRSLVKTGADLAATFGGTTTDAVNALASAFKGEFDPLEQYGISIKQSAINTEAYRIVGVKTKSAFDELSTAQQNAAKQQATTNLLTQQAAKTQGAFAKETDTLAHQQQVLNAQWENLKAQLGTALLPAVTDFVQLLNDEVVPAVSVLAERYLPRVTSALSDLFAGDPGAGAAAFGDALSGVDWEGISSSASDLFATLGELGPALADIGVAGVNDSLSVFAEVVGFAADHLETLRKLMPVLVAGFLAYKAAQVANTIAGRDSLIGLALQWTATRRLIAANRELAAVTREVAIAQGVSTGAVGTAGAAIDKTTGKMSKLGAAAKGAAGIAGLGLLAAGATESDASLGGLETTAGAVATGFAVGGPWGAAIGGAVGLVMSLTNATDGLEDSMASLNDAMRSNDVDALSASIKSTRAELDAATASTIYGSDALGGFIGNVVNTVSPLSNTTRFMGGLTGKTEETAAALERAETRLAEMRAGTYEAGFALGDFAYVIERNAEASREEADALRDATDAMRDKRAEAARGLNAQLDYQEAIDQTAASVRENGKTVNKSTEAGRANLRNLYALAGAWNDQSDAVKNAKGSLAGARKSFVDAATSMGMSEGAAKKLANQLLEIKSRNVKVAVDGVAAATQQVRTLKEVMDQTKSKDIYINLHYQTIGNKPKAPLPGDPNTREVAPRSLAERKADAYNDGLRVGDAFAKGAAKATGKLGKLIRELFGSKGATAGLEAITRGIEGAAAMVERVVGKRIKDDKKAAKAQARILDGLRAQGKALRENGRLQDENTAKLDDARAKVLAYSEAIRTSFVSFGDITQLGRTDTGKVTLPKLLRELGQRAAQAEEFNTLLQQLAQGFGGAGLSQTQIEQLTAAGPEAALATARAIAAGGQNAIDQVNTLSASIATSGGVLGAALSDRFAIAGQRSAGAYITTLESEQARLDKTASKMAKAYVKELQAELAKVGSGKGDGGGGDGNGGNNRHARQVTTEAFNNGGRQAVRVHLTAQQRNAIERGREIQLDLDTYRAAGGRSRR